MEDILKLFKETSPVLIIAVILAYFLKVFIEKRLEGIASRIDDIAQVSVDLKRDLRGEERSELVTFRVAVEKWEYFLQTMLFDFAMSPPSKASVASFYKEDRNLFLDVKIAVIKASIYICNKDLELQLMAAIEKIRKTYYPLINEELPRLIDIQTKMIPIENKLNQFVQSGMQDMSFAPTEKDREDQLKLQELMTNELTAFSEKMLKKYKEIADQIHDLKEAINHYIYRPIEHTAINKD